MKVRLLCLLFLFATLPVFAQETAWIRINQLGYLERSAKVAVLVSKQPISCSDFEVLEGEKVIFRSAEVKAYGKYAAFTHTFRLNFSAFGRPGTFRIRAAGVTSPAFRIGNDVYDGTADFLLKYMRQQRSNYNPFLKDTCHRYDGFIVYHPDPKKDSTHLDVSGGWHDASDYLQYLPTSANATFQLLFAYYKTPKSFGDAFDAWGNPGKNGIPDILDEARWGLRWMVKMNPGPGEYYNQIADDRDHAGLRLPNKDSVRYAANKGLARPVYFITGKPQGAFRYKNRTQGVASSAGKFASAFALGSLLLKEYDAAFAADLAKRAKDAYAFGKQFPGTTQTAPGRAPYFYEEDNYVDDMELAALALHKLNASPALAQDALAFAKQEPVTPWMGADTARHYQWYPFVNLGHYLGAAGPGADAARYREFMKQGIDKVLKRGERNPFLNGVPFIWCSNNLVAGIVTQIRLYREVTGDASLAEAEAAYRDWLFGCNPWGTSMICDLPESGTAPKDPHSAFTHLYGYKIPGGLVDGPIYGSIWNKLIGIKLVHPDEYEAFQSGLVVYHDDFGDYSTNEPTMDGTASLSYYLSSLQEEGTVKKKSATRRAR
ncbi:glycoside hydrolase family 9 protein [Siphonobacter aquaeclarae]|uniref:glycoside hydrolase family 9 protein n=1 Tax=Siphonobacter aquaeclarae TaxID=563176 RepID=UPI000A74C34A|nr:glycoside hydrolase family 9 protein [Siphonobacter aquaeclarae]